MCGNLMLTGEGGQAGVLMTTSDIFCLNSVQIVFFFRRSGVSDLWTVKDGADELRGCAVIQGSAPFPLSPRILLVNFHSLLD